MRRALALIVALASLAVAGPAPADTPLEIALQDDPVFVRTHYYDRDRALAQARALGVTRIRAHVTWADVLNDQAKQRTQPSPLVYDFTAHDNLIDAAAAYGIRIQLNFVPHAPAFATGDRKVGVERPNPRMYAEFVRTAVEHFKGRVDRYALWNEPNHVGWLTPQSTAASQYRNLYREGYRAVKAADPKAKVLIGELVPYRNGNRSSSPLSFLRELTCTRTAAGVPGARGYRMAKRGSCSGLRADGLAHHPYEYRGPPESGYPGTDNVTIGTLSRLTTTLRELSRLRALATPKLRPVEVYLTEFGYFGAGRNAHPDIRRASYLRRSFEIAVKDPMVRQMLQYLLVRPPRNYPGSFFDMAIVMPNGTEMAPFKEIARWAARAGQRGQVVVPGAPISLPPRPSGIR
jgi:hypothetical protein